MTRHLLDSCIIIDYLRGREGAAALLEARSARLSISVVSIAELYEGVRSSAEEDTLLTVLRQLESHDVTASIARQAGLWRLQFRRSHGVAMPDALIAATADAHGARLVTRNVRHFPMLDDLLVPYQ